MTSQTERAQTIRPNKDANLQPVCEDEEASGEGNVEGAEKDEGVVPLKEQGQGQEEQWQQVNQKVEELADQVTRYFNDDNEKNSRQPPTIKAPSKPTKEEWERHQTTHTPYAAWCKHCVAARNVRRNHPSHGRRGKLVPDVERDDGPTKVSLVHMYLHGRVGKYRDVQSNPPYLVII